MGCLSVGNPGFEPRLVVFDKDGTLIDFHAMWATWIEALANHLENASGHSCADLVYQAVRYDRLRRRALPGGPLAIMPMRDLRDLVASAIAAAGVEPEAAKQLVDAHWFTPDPVASATPLTDLARLFAHLKDCGIEIGIATSDDRSPTEATLAAFRVDSFVCECACADDAIKPKPAADMVLAICQRVGVLPAQTLVVGDSAAVLQMAMAAQVGLRVGVLSGVSSFTELSPYADCIIDSVAHLVSPWDR
jgi:phosphoglycolate phosphatase-like HAD superfamily hydrolase